MASQNSTSPDFYTAGVGRNGTHGECIKLDHAQEVGAEFLSNRRRAGLFDMQGCGKTFTMLEAAVKVQAGTIVIICPNIAVEMWRTEIHRYLSKGVGVSVVSSGKKPPTIDTIMICPYSLVWKKTVLPTLKAVLDGMENSVLICDEGHFLKSQKSKRTRAVYKTLSPKGGLAYIPDYCWVATGTPMPNNPSELWTHFKILCPEGIQTESGATMKFWDFAERFCTVKEDRFGKHIGGGKELDVLNYLLKKFSIRRKLKNVGMRISPLSFAMTTKERKDLISEVGDAQFDPDPEYWDMEHIATVQRLTGVIKAPYVAEYAELLLEGGAENLVIFYSNTDAGSILMERLSKFNPVLISGGVSSKLKTKAQELFWDKKARVLIGQIDACGTAINLQCCHNVIMAQASWVPGNNDQAIARCARRGQTHLVNVWFAHLQDSIDDNVSLRLMEKSRVIKRTIDNE